MAERNCRKCFHFKACKEVASRSGYRDVSYTESQCKHFTPTADVVEVVRCKNCKHSRPMIFSGFHYCKRVRAVRKEDDFCSKGTSKERGDK